MVSLRDSEWYGWQRCTKYTLKTRYGTRGGWILQGTFDVDYPRTMAHHYLNKVSATHVE